MVYGYARVSSESQNLNRQLDALSQYGVPSGNIYTDKKSGKDFDRPSYKKLVSLLEEGDILIILSIDRLGRNYDEIREQWSYITKTLKADIKVIDMPLLDTSKNKDILGSFISDLVLQILSFVAQTEREFIKTRQKEGIKAAKLRGVKFGKPRKELPPNFDDIYQSYLDGNNIHALTKIADGLSYSTLRRRIKEREKEECSDT